MARQPETIPPEGLESRSVRLESAELDFWVDVTLLRLKNRSLAVASISGDKELGFGDSDEEALAGALASLGQEVTDILLRT